MKPKAGDVFWVRAKPGLPQGVRSRGGQVFNDREDRRVTVVSGSSLLGDEVSVKAAGEILADSALTVTDQPPYDVHGAIADALVDIAVRDEQIAKLREENAALREENAALREENAALRALVDAKATE